MSDPDEIRNDIERTRMELGQDVDALADKVTPSKIAERQTRKVKRAFSRVTDRVMGSASDAVDSAQDAVGNAADVPHKAARATEGNPIAAGLIAFGVGMLVSSLIPATRQEQRLAEQAKEAAAPILDEAKDVATEAADHLREPAREAAESVKERAAEAAETVKSEGADAASTVQSDAKHAADRQMGG
jgi:gas vesicle protein